MRKAGKRQALSKPRKQAAGPGEVNPFLDLLQQAEPDLIRALEQVIRDGAGQANLLLSRQLPLAGRDIASGAALDEIPLMQHVAQHTVWPFEARV